MENIVPNKTEMLSENQQDDQITMMMLGLFTLLGFLVLGLFIGRMI